MFWNEERQLRADRAQIINFSNTCGCRRWVEHVSSNKSYLSKLIKFHSKKCHIIPINSNITDSLIHGKYYEHDPFILLAMA